MHKRTSIDGDSTPKSIDQIIYSIVELCQLDSESITEKALKSHVPYNEKNILLEYIREYKAALHNSKNHTTQFINHELIIQTIERLLKSDEEVENFTRIEKEEDEGFILI